MSSRVLVCAGKVLRIPSPGDVLRVDPAALPATVSLNMPDIHWNAGTPKSISGDFLGSFQATLVTDATEKTFPYYSFNATPVWPQPPDYTYPKFVGVPSGTISLYPAADTLQWNVKFVLSWNRGFNCTLRFKMPINSTMLGPCGDYAFVSRAGYFDGPQNIDPPYTVSTP